MAPRKHLTANTVAEGRAERGVAKDAPGGCELDHPSRREAFASPLRHEAVGFGAVLKFHLAGYDSSRSLVALSRQVLGEALEEVQASDELRLVHELVRLMRHVDRARPADDGRQTGGLKVAGLRGE